jgi:hypothetical protein
MENGDTKDEGEITCYCEFFEEMGKINRLLQPNIFSYAASLSACSFYHHNY